MHKQGSSSVHWFSPTARLALVALVAFTAPDRVAAQAVTLLLGNGTAGTAVAGTGLSSLRIPVRVQFGSGSQVNLAAVQGDVRWDPVAVRLDSARLVPGGPFTLTANMQEAAAGRYRFSLFAPNGVTQGRELVWLYFTPQQAIADTGVPVTLGVDAAGDEMGRSLVPGLPVQSTRLCRQSPRCR